MPLTESVVIFAPSTDRLNVFEPVAAPLTDISMLTVPVTVAPSLGLVIETVSDGFVTVTSMLFCALWPVESVTITVSLCGPAVTVLAVVSQLYDAFAADTVWV